MLMPRALWLLKYLEIRGWARRFLRLLKRPAGIVILLFYIFMFGPAMFNAIVLDRGGLKISAEWVSRAAPLGLALMCLMALLKPGSGFFFNFKPAEIDLLFTGPYTRRHLITYKLLGNVSGALFFALITFVSSFAFFPSRLSMFLGVFLAFLFVFLFSTLYGTVMQAVSGRIRFIGYAISAAGIFAVAFSFYAVFQDVGSVMVTPDPALLFESVLAHPIVKAVSFPFIPFARAMTDGPLLEFVLWVAVCAAMIAAEYVLIVWLDADYMESAMTRSARQYEAFERFRRGQVMSYRSAVRRRSWTLPMLPRWSGYGPIAWRQLLGAAHNWGRTILVLYVICIAGGLAFSWNRKGEGSGEMVLPFLFGILVYVSILMTNLFRFDFRSEIDTMDSLKTLPISGSTIALAQITAPAVLLCTVYFAFAISFALAFRRLDVFLAMGFLAPPFATLLMAIENLTFLIWPVRLAQPGNVDAQSVGRGLLSFLVKGVILVPACAIAVAVAFANRYLLDSWGIGYLSAGVILAIEAGLMIPLVAAAYNKFDPSTDTPP